jgi:hypothetical protein
MNNHRPLTEYFSKTVQASPPNFVKESTMFDNVKASMQIVRDKLTLLWTQQPPATFVDDTNEKAHNDFWAFEMYTDEWVDFAGEGQPARHTWIQEPHEGTWMGVLDTILDAMNAHYGYNIKEQVYYSVKFPMNGICPYTDEPFPGHGRSLNDDVLQKLLLAYPEVYESTGSSFDWKPL